MAFSMQDLMGKLPGSPGGQPQVAPNFNPQINKKQLATDVQVNKDIIKADKNQQLGLMLHALGGALRGDENFVQNTMAIQTMQEGKKKKEERTKNYKEFLETLDPKSPFYSLAKTMGADKLDQLLMEKFKADTRVPKKKTASDYVADIMAKVQNVPGYVMTDEDKRILQVSRKADPATMMIEDITAGAIAGSGIGQTGVNLQTFASTADAKAAGLKSGDQFIGSDGNRYTVQ
tara:strand:+ start:99 stop:794 length:696 start_codon:yes stop_codon:yes gene_type:complete